MEAKFVVQTPTLKYVLHILFLVYKRLIISNEHFPLRRQYVLSRMKIESVNLCLCQPLLEPSQ